MVTSVGYLYTSLLCARCKLIDSVVGERAFSTADHIQAVKEEQRKRKKYWYDANDVKLWVIISDQSAFEKRLLLCAKNGWELPILHYHEIMVIYPYPFLVVITQFFY